MPDLPHTPSLHSFDCFTRLREVWLGDVYPVHFYDHLDSQVRDTFRIITEWTKQDLDFIEQWLTDWGVVVRRPKYDGSVQDYMINGTLRKPEITPRDNYMVLGNQFVVNHRSPMQDPVWPWKSILGEYLEDARSELLQQSSQLWLSGANSVRLGLDYYLDCVWQTDTSPWSRGHGKSSAALHEIFDQEIVPMFGNFRCHYIDNGGHVDACFAVLRPGVLLCTGYFDSYDALFPGWKKINIAAPEFHDQHRPPNYIGFNGRWSVPELDMNPAFNEHVVRFAQDWVGNYTETYFEVNCLVLDEKNVMVLGEDQKVQAELYKHGITAHVMPFRCRTFWDGGLHCLTLDIRRDGGAVDHFLS